MTEPLYATSDLHLAAFLVNEGASFVGLRRIGPKKVLFSFVACRELHVLLRVYWGCHPVPIVPAHLLAALHRLKCLAITRP